MKVRWSSFLRYTNTIKTITIHYTCRKNSLSRFFPFSQKKNTVWTYKCIHIQILFPPLFAQFITFFVYFSSSFIYTFGVFDGVECLAMCYVCVLVSVSIMLKDEIECARKSIRFWEIIIGCMTCPWLFGGVMVPSLCFYFC